MKNTALVMKITRGSLSDGDGIRTVVFLKGCNLRCRWCHNPEGISFESQVMVYPEKCVRCGKCAEISPGEFVLDELSAKHVGAVGESTVLCQENCPKSAIEIVGREMTPGQVFDEIVRDQLFYRKSKGGVTFSGGECLMQTDFLEEVLTLCKEQGISAALETALNTDFARIQPLIDLVDLFIVDLKHMDNAKHQFYTGCENTRILENVKKLFSLHSNILFRVPLIPTVNDGMENLAATVDFVAALKGNGEKRIELLKYNDLAKSKYEALQMPFVHFGTPQTQPQLDEICQQLKDRTSQVEIFHN